MKIDVRYNYLKTKFGDLKPGDAFVNCGTVYMKIANVAGASAHAGKTYNAVRLGTGDLIMFSDIDYVTNARVVAHTEIIE